MKINAQITQDRELKIDVDLSEENSTTRNVWVTNIEIFNTHSYLDGVSVYQKRFRDYNTPGDTNPEFTNPFVIAELNMNTFDSITNEGNCHSTDIFNDIMIVNVSFGYSVSYQANSTCCSQTPSVSTIALYNSCTVYSYAINAISECNCKDMCEDNLPYGFMYALLKKKAIDACLECGHYDQACRYYIKFFRQDNCNCQKPCGCSDKSKPKTTNSENTQTTVTKKCNCNGRNS